MSKAVRIGLAGNPNSGKTTLFNCLTGARQKVGNYPGVTVERKEGVYKGNGHTIHITDLPGTYSLTAYSIEEIVARDFIVQIAPMSLWTFWTRQTSNATCTLPFNLWNSRSRLYWR